MARDTQLVIRAEYLDKDLKKAMADIKALEAQAGKSADGLDSLGRTGKIALAAAAAAAAAAGYAMLQFGKDSIMAASDFEEVQNKVNQVFGPRGRAELNAWAETANTAFGLSKTAALDAASQFGIFGKSAGLTGESLQTFSTDLSQLAGDLASFNNTTVDEALQALGAGLRGESEPLRRFGVLLDDATLKARAMEMGIYNGTGSLTQQQRVLAAQAEILAQTTVQQGDFARTADGLANTMRVLSASVENAKTEIGQGLYFAVNQMIRSMGGSAGLAQTIEDTADSVADLSYGIGGLIRDLYNLGTATADGTSEGQGFLKTLQGLILASPQLRGFVTAGGFVRTYGEATRAAEEATAAQADEIARLTAGIRGYIPMVQQAARDNYSFVQSTGAATDRLTAQARAYGAEISFTGGTLSAWRSGLDATAESLKRTGVSTASATKTFGDLRKELLASLQDSPAERYAGIITQLKDNLRNAEQAFTAFKDSVVSSITQAFSFGDAYQAAQQSGITFLDALTKQAENAVLFADRIKQLVILGLSPEALQQVLAAGVTAGTGIANQLIEGGATTIEQTNRLVETSMNAANEVALLAASSYFGAGVKSAEDTLSGFEAQLGPGGPSNKRLQRIMDDLAASMRRETTVTVTTIHRSVYESVGLPGRAMGGPVSANTAYVVGERGPEVFVPDIAGTIIPNNVAASPARGGIGGSINLTVNAGMGTDGAEVGRQIVDALRQYQRRNGPVPISVA